MEFMRISRLAVAAALAISPSWAAAAASLTSIKTVYILPMPGNLDQFLAMRLTIGSILQVVTDPAKADAIFTPQTGAAFEQRMTELYAQKPKASDTKDADGKDANPPLVASYGRTKGMVFLVDRKSHDVVWSMYVKPKNMAPDEMARLAEKISQQLSKDVKEK